MTRKSERTKQRIVEAANRLFYHKGYHRSSFTDVVEAANVPRGNIYYYFKTKEDILQAAIQHRLARIKAMLQNWSDTYRTPLERLHRFLNMLPNSMESLAEYGCPMGTLNAELGKDSERLHDEARALFQVFEDWLTEQFTELGYAGHARQLAQRLISRGQGISMLTHVHGDAGFLDRETRLLKQRIDNLAAGADPEQAL